MVTFRELIKEYNHKRDVRDYLIGIQANLGKDVKICEVITKLNIDLIVLEKKISNNNTEQ